MLTLNDLHDVILKKIEVCWESGNLKINLESYIDGKIENIEITAEGLTSLNLPRFYAWGPSSLINKAWEEGSGEAKKLTIEMQSGDVIEIRIYGFLIQRTL